MTTTFTTDQIAATVLARCESPNTIETGLTSTPVYEQREMFLLDDSSEILSIIAQRFPIICSRILGTADAREYLFIITEMPRGRGHHETMTVTIYDDEFIIAAGSVKINGSSEAVAYAKAINAIAEFAQTQVAS